METNKLDMRTKFSLLWIFVLFNMIYADILGFITPGFMQEILSGHAGSVQLTPGFLLIAAICLEIPIAMVLLSRILKHRINRWANIVAGVFTIAFVIGGGSATPHYIFFATIGVVSLLLIIWYAWKWKTTEVTT